MDIEGSVCLVTGANRGLGKVLAQSLLEAGAAKVYAGVRDPAIIKETGAGGTGTGVIPVRLDITSAADVARAADACRDVTILVNNAGIMRGTRPVDDTAEEDARAEMETNYFGTLRMCRAFAPVLAASGGGTLVNVLSVTSWLATPFNGTYCSSKAAEWLLTNAFRLHLRSQGTQVIGVYASFIDTDMAEVVTTGLARISPEDVAAQTLEAIRGGIDEVLTDERTRAVKAALSHDIERLYGPL
jgi:NAD(P)-dependent dehydrogenase (short-subunit alcohol dehydrogenase family)